MVLFRCNNCGNEFSTKHKVCPKCGTPVPRYNPTIRITVTYWGSRIRRTVKCNVTTAKQIEAEIKLKLVRGETIADHRSFIKLKDFVRREYLRYSQENKSLHTYAREKGAINAWLLPLFGHKPLHEISQLDVEKLKREMTEAGRSPRSIQYTITILRNILNRADDLGYKVPQRDPTKKVKIPKADNRRVRFLTYQEAEALLEEIKKHSQQTYEICFLALYTGMRAGEIFNLTWQDIDFKNRLIHIKDTKNRENRVAYMTDELVELLQARKKRLGRSKTTKDQLVFQNNKGKKISKVSHTFFRAVNALGLNNFITDNRDKVVFHTLRHTFASWLAMSGVPIYTIKELMGHKSIEMTERYSHLAPDTKRQAVEMVFNSNNNVLRIKDRKQEGGA